MCGVVRLLLKRHLASRHLGFGPTGNGCIRSAVPENRTLESNTIRPPVPDISSFEVSKMAEV